jgi:hypothetical protein
MPCRELAAKWPNRSFGELSEKLAELKPVIAGGLEGNVRPLHSTKRFRVGESWLQTGRGQACGRLPGTSAESERSRPSSVNLWHCCPAEDEKHCCPVVETLYGQVFFASRLFLRKNTVLLISSFVNRRVSTTACQPPLGCQPVDRLTEIGSHQTASSGGEAPSFAPG